MSMNNLTIDGEFRYIIQWFNEWSELQREDFVPIIVNYVTGKETNDGNQEHQSAAFAAATTPVNMNGLHNEFELNGKPMSLFQCRVKLFNQWNRKWPHDFKEKLQQKISEIDGKVGEKITAALNPNNGILTNGNGTKEETLDEMHFHENEPKSLEAATNTAAQVMMTTLNDPMAEVLNNETSVDDIETNEDINNSNNNRLGQQINHKADDAGDNDDDGGNSSTRQIHVIHDNRGEPVEQVVQMQNLKINEEDEENHEDVTVTVEQPQQQQQPQQQPVTVTVNPTVVVTQTIATNAEVPLVV